MDIGKKISKEETKILVAKESLRIIKEKYRLLTKNDSEFKKRKEQIRVLNHHIHDMEGRVEVLKTFL